MPRFARAVVPGCPHHLIQRGNRRQRVFFSLTLIGRAARKYGIRRGPRRDHVPHFTTSQRSRTTTPTRAQQPAKPRTSTSRGFMISQFDPGLSLRDSISS